VGGGGRRAWCRFDGGRGEVSAEWEGDQQRRAVMVADGVAAWLEERDDRGDGLGPKANRAE
jgi:hypothetical protein